MENNNLLEEIKTEIRCVLVSNPKSMTVDELARDYRKIIGKPILYYKLGYSDLIDFLRDIPDIVKVIGQHPQMAILTPVIAKRLENLNKLIMKQRVTEPKRGQSQTKRETEISKTCKVNQLEAILEERNEKEISSISSQDLAKDDACIEISEKIREQLKQLIQRFPNGLPVQLLAQIYEEHFKEILNINELGFESALQFCNAVSDIWYILVSEQSADYYLIDITKELPAEENKSEQSIKSSLEPRSSSILNNLTVSDVMNESDNISSLITLLKTKEGQTVKILISEIYSPTRFWFLIYDQNHFHKLFDIMDDMRSFYSDNKNSYNMPEKDIKTNLYCAVCLSGVWQRAHIICIVDELTVKVFLIDFGPIVVTHKTNIFYLHKKFQSFPRQACRGRLHLVIPSKKEKNWNLIVTKHFVSMVTEKLLLARLMRVEETESIAWVVIKYDDKKNCNLTINEAMITKGYAEICSKSKAIYGDHFRNIFAD